MEWEFAARGADPDHKARYPWGDRISHPYANYRATPFYPYDESKGGLSEKVARTEHTPYLPVGSLPGHGYENEFHEMIGNAEEIVMTGFHTGSAHIQVVMKGGSWATDAKACAIPSRRTWDPYGSGFRVLLPTISQPQARNNLHD
jgi:formylglycine-generating enzyme required for sulfatase activity